MLHLHAQSAGAWSAIALPGDKSVAHRALLCAALASGCSTIAGAPDSDDVRATLEVLTALRVAWQRDGESIVVTGCGGQWPAHAEFTIAASGTTLRLTLGLLAAGQGTYTIRVGAQLARRSIQSVVDALQQMGAQIAAHHWNTPDAHIIITGQPLRGMRHALAEPSAQLKSAITLAALQATGNTIITEPERTRDHLERMLPDFGADVRYENSQQFEVAPQPLRGTNIIIPGDPSAAAFWAIGAILRNQPLTIPNVSLNPFRIGWIEVLKRMGAPVSAFMLSERVASAGGLPMNASSALPALIQSQDDFARCRSWGEPMTGPVPHLDPYGQINVTISHQQLSPIEITAAEIPGVIDELPILAIAAAFANGTSRLHQLTRLRGKESDRIAAIQALLQLAGRRSELTADDTLTIYGDAHAAAPLGDLPITNDHRVVMSAAMLALRGAPGAQLHVADADAVAKSYPDFWRQFY